VLSLADPKILKRGGGGEQFISTFVIYCKCPANGGALHRPHPVWNWIRHWRCRTVAWSHELVATTSHTAAWTGNDGSGAAVESAEQVRKSG